MDNWLKTYGKFLNFSVLELELGLPSGSLQRAQNDPRSLSPKYYALVEKFLFEMEKELKLAKSKI